MTTDCIEINGRRRTIGFRMANLLRPPVFNQISPASGNPPFNRRVGGEKSTPGGWDRGGPTLAHS